MVHILFNIVCMVSIILIMLQFYIQAATLLSLHGPNSSCSLSGLFRHHRISKQVTGNHIILSIQAWTELYMDMTSHYLSSDWLRLKQTNQPNNSTKKVFIHCQNLSERKILSGTPVDPKSYKLELIM